MTGFLWGSGPGVRRANRKKSFLTEMWSLVMLSLWDGHMVPSMTWGPVRARETPGPIEREELTMCFGGSDLRH